MLRLWELSEPEGDNVISEIGRFNEAIDQAVAESVAVFQQEVERWRAVFLGILGHELRAPLNAMLLTSHLMGKPTTESQAGDNTQRLVRSGRRMAALLDDLLEYNRSSLGLGLRVEMAGCDLASALREEVEMRRAGLRDADITLVAPESCPGEWDASRLRQVVGNLISNAVHHGTAGAPITVRLEPLDTQVRITVENAGPPVPDHMKWSIFEPLRRAAGAGDERSNLGLGLFIAREIVHKHQGSIEVASTEGKTCFTVLLPRERAGAAAAP